MTETTARPPVPVAALRNLAHFHREHEKFYAIEPLRRAEAVLRASRTLKALADRWSRTDLRPAAGGGPAYTGCEDLNDPTAIETSGVLFMEGTTEPAELTQLKHDLRSQAMSGEQTGAWLKDAMTASWDSAGALLRVSPLAELLGERHRIIANNWLAADMSRLSAALLNRAADILEAVDFTPGGLRTDLAGPRVTPGYLYSAALLLDRSADLSVTSTTLTRDSEPAWRQWQARVDTLDSHGG
ncbi:hypothetical protein SAMN04515671_1733 [Nakamurella panacisegetis]|uniref:Uncharacterized protein n=1 Tax=Nakamurella panacisegetis TaxID=1090615 RepID=A0A1H0LNS3_9ACTN|nr:hypothetical protein [Nakamurella panacisegetis]SDO69666.1 hypothetical protein SAMN04515671_1733 [Nakamurella panacisegetis]